MKKIIITESQAKTIINELFGSDYIYPIKVTEDNKFRSNLSQQAFRSIRYEFITKDEVTYQVLISIWRKDRVGRIDFSTYSENPEHNSFLALINTHDAIKVFNTLKSIVEKHRKEIDELIMPSSPDRVKFYKKLLDYLNIKYKYANINYEGTIIATL